MSGNIYACDPSESAAEVCWPAPASVLCLFDPWSKTLRRFPSPGALPAVDPPANPMPFALLLDDATRCILPNGLTSAVVQTAGCRCTGVDGDVVEWRCSGSRYGSCSAAINRSRPVWTVIVGQLGPPNTPMGFVAEHSVTTAWFAGN